jgi:hypothetical protein
MTDYMPTLQKSSSLFKVNYWCQPHLQNTFVTKATWGFDQTAGRCMSVKLAHKIITPFWNTLNSQSYQVISYYHIWLSYVERCRVSWRHESRWDKVIYATSQRREKCIFSSSHFNNMSNFWNIERVQLGYLGFNYEWESCFHKADWSQGSPGHSCLLWKGLLRAFQDSVLPMACQSSGERVLEPQPASGLCLRSSTLSHCSSSNTHLDFQRLKPQAHQS